MKLWFFHEFVCLFEPYGQMMALDPATAKHLDFHAAQIRVGLCDDRHIPNLSWIMYYDQNGYWTRYDVAVKVEQDLYAPPPHSPPPPGGGNGDLMVAIVLVGKVNGMTQGLVLVDSVLNNLLLKTSSKFR